MAAEFRFTKIFDTPGAYGMETVDISRQGINGHRLKETGKRGRRKQLQARALFNTKEDANAFIDALTEKKGASINARNLLDDTEYTVHLYHFEHSIIQKVVSSDSTYNWRVDFDLDCVRVS